METIEIDTETLVSAKEYANVLILEQLQNIVTKSKFLDSLTEIGQKGHKVIPKSRLREYLDCYEQKETLVRNLHEKSDVWNWFRDEIQAVTRDGHLRKTPEVIAFLTDYLSQPRKIR